MVLLFFSTVSILTFKYDVEIFMVEMIECLTFVTKEYRRVGKWMEEDMEQNWP